jgi:hypothetical protein
MRNLLLYEIQNNQFEVTDTDYCDIKDVFQKKQRLLF